MYWNQWDATGGKPVGSLHATSAGISVSSRNRSIWSLFHGPRIREAFTRAARRARYAVLQVFEALDLLDEFRFHRIDSPAPSREKGNAVRQAEESSASDPRPTASVANYR